MKKLSLIFIISGIILLLYPTLNRAYYDYKQDKVLKEWKESMDNIESIDFDDENENNPENLPYETDNTEEGQVSQDEGDNQIDKNSNNTNYNNNKYILKIDKINLYLPILNGATTKNLDISLARMNYTAEPGDIGNFAVAGHRSYTYGRHFNRLNEMKKGDKIQVITPNEKFTYKVTETLVVEPDELWVLKGNNKEKMITLVTCTPIRKATHRLIVKGKLIE